MTILKSTLKNISTLMLGAVMATSFAVSDVSAQGRDNSNSSASSAKSSKSAPKGQVVNIVALRDSYLSSNPEKQSLNVMRHKNKGFMFFADGRVLYRTQGNRVVETMTRISSANLQEVCIAPSGAFIGGCLTLTKNSGKMTMHYRFNNGKGGSWDARILG